MNNIEELLWNYIDGNCTADEQKTVSNLIAQDEAYRLKYHELLKLNNEFAAMEMDEPPMAFTYNVMESIRAEHALKPLKATVNKKIIIGIAVFFMLVLTGLLVFTLANIKLSAADVSVKIPSSMKMPDLSNFISKPVIQGFWFFDVILGLFLFDAWLRKKKMSKQL